MPAPAGRDRATRDPPWITSGPSHTPTSRKWRACIGRSFRRPTPAAGIRRHTTPISRASSSRTPPERDRSPRSSTRNATAAFVGFVGVVPRQVAIGWPQIRRRPSARSSSSIPQPSRPRRGAAGQGVSRRARRICRSPTKRTTWRGRSGKDSAARPRCCTVCTGRARCGRRGWHCPMRGSDGHSHRSRLPRRRSPQRCDALAARLPGSQFRQVEPSSGMDDAPVDALVRIRPAALRRRHAPRGVRRAHLSAGCSIGRPAEPAAAC